MKRWALMQGNTCTNVIEQDATPTTPGTWVEITGQAVGPGNRWDGSSWLAPAVLSGVPTSVPMAKARLALLAIGKLAAVNTVVATKTEAIRIKWEYNQEIRRDSPLVNGLAPAVGLSDADLDALFIAAAQIE